MDPVEGDVYVVTEDIGGPEREVLFKGPYTDESPRDADAKVEFINKVLSDKNIATLTDEEIQFVKSR